jgi:hypothetical protein
VEHLVVALREVGLSLNEVRFGPLRTFVIGGSNHPTHVELARHLHAYLRRRNAHAPPRRAGRPTPGTRQDPKRTTTPLGQTRRPRRLGCGDTEA